MNKSLYKSVTPANTFINAATHKQMVLASCRSKSGIYRWVNNINNNTYVGSASDLSKRFRTYYNVNELKKTSRPIHNALLKYGYENFTLDILEYCDKECLMEREQYYLDLLLPEYNILKHAYSLTGFKHSEETIAKLKEKIISPEHRSLLSSIHKGKVVDKDTKLKLAMATKEFRKTSPLTKEALDLLRNKTIEREGVAVSVIDITTNEVKEFTNQTEAGNFMGITRQAVYNAIKRNSIVNNKYKVTKK